jgi:ubiquinone/menaquinone biosynthesis C-methylase UbiE
MNDAVQHSSNAFAEIRDAWDNIAQGYDAFVTPTHFVLGSEGLRLAGLEPGMQFLDVAAGSGALSIPAARLGAKVLATDASPVMLDRLEARARDEGLELDTRVMDGHALDLEAETFDMAGSQFGVMLFPDMPRGLAELARVTRPGGRVLMIAFGNPEKVEFFGFFIQAVRAVIPDFTGPPMDPPPLPFQLREPGRLRDEMLCAGLKEAKVETTTEKLEFSSGRELWNWLTTSNPIVEAVLHELDLTGEQRSLIQHVLDEMVAKRSGADRCAVLTSPINIGIGIK